MNIAAVHLTTLTKEMGSPILAASMVIFGDEQHMYHWVSSHFRDLATMGEVDEFKEKAVEFLWNSGAECIEPDMFASRIIGRQTAHLCTATIWQTDTESHISHYAYLYAVTEDKRKLYRKGFNFDGLSLNALHKHLGGVERSVPTETDSHDAGLYYLKELYIKCRELLGHDLKNDNQKILRDNAPKLAVASENKTTVIPVPGLPPLPGKPSAPALPPFPGMPPLPPLPGK